MTLATTAWPDGGQIPKKHTQAGEQVSPPLTWSNVPDGTESFVLIAHDLDAATGGGNDDHPALDAVEHPWSERAVCPKAWPPAPQLPDGTRQISVSGPYYRGPGAPASGPAHHYVFELYALDAPITVPAVGQSPGAHPRRGGRCHGDPRAREGGLRRSRSNGIAKTAES